MNIRFTDRISFKLARTGVILAFIIGFILSTTLVYRDYLNEDSHMSREINRILTVSEKPASRAVHILDEELANEVVDGLLNYSFIIEAVITDDLGIVLATKEKPFTKSPTRWLTKRITDEYSEYSIALKTTADVAIKPGALIVTVDNDVVLSEFFNRAGFVFLSGLVRNMALVLLLFVSFYLMITKPLANLAQQFSTIRPDKPGDTILYVNHNHDRDELGLLAENGNRLLTQVSKLLEEQKARQAELQQAKTMLEDRVQERTRELAIRSRDLEAQITENHYTQKALQEAKDHLEQRVEERTRELRNQITERMKIEENLRKLSHAVEQSPVSVVITDTQGNIEYVNPKFVQVTGYEQDEIFGKNIDILNSGQTPDNVWQDLWDTVSMDGEWQGEFLNKKKNGELFWERAYVSPIKAMDGTTTHYLSVKEDITLQKEYEERLFRQANYDEITGLPNRTLFIDSLNKAIIQAQKNNKKVGLLFIDLDQFKRVNDTMGHDAGDALLKIAADRLPRCIRDGDTLARIGGDEFSIILPDIKDETDAEHVANKIKNVFDYAFDLNGVEVYVTVSTGIAIYPDDGTTSQTLMRNVDTAMYEVKNRGRDAFGFFNPDLMQGNTERIRKEMLLRQALEKSEFYLLYQPLIDIQTSQVIGAEALIRWENEELGFVGPDQFIPLAEETGLIVPIGAWTIIKACEEAQRWRDNGSPDLRLAINISSRQFRDGNLLEIVKGALDNSGLPPEALELEITESLLMDDRTNAGETLKSFRDMGIGLSVDDFGTGYSSLSYIKKFPISTIKIDRAFVNDVTVDEEDAALCRAIIAMAQSLGHETIGEGVETAEQFQFLKENGCSQAQGYYFAKPLTGDAYLDYVKDNMVA